MHKLIPLTNPIGQPYCATESEKTVPEDGQEELRRPASSEDNVPNYIRGGGLSLFPASMGAC